MASPIEAGTNIGNSVAASLPVTFDTTPSVGELLIVEFAWGGATTNTASYTGTGWTQSATNSANGGTVVPNACLFYKVADGSDSLTLNLASSSRAEWIARRITGAGAVSIQFSSGTGAAADPPNNAPGAGSKDYLSLAGMAVASATVASAAPAGYSNLLTSTTNGGHSLASAKKALTAAASENPDAFTNVNAAWVAWTTLIAPSAGGATTHATSGVLTGPGTTVAGSATRFRAFATSGALTGQGSTLAGSATRFRAFSASGALVGAGAQIVGSSARIGAPVTHATSGALTGAGATIVGTAHLTSLNVWTITAPASGTWTTVDPATGVWAIL